MKVGETIIVNAWGKFGGMKLTCTEIGSHPVFGTEYVFDNGMRLYELELENNLELWKLRGGYKII